MVAHARDTPLYGYFPSTTAFLRVLSVFCIAMWLTALLLGARWTPGKQWIGKHRRVLKMTATRRRNQEEREAQIKRVSAMLSQSYLTQDEELHHARERRLQYVPKFVHERRARWMKRSKEAFREIRGGSGQNTFHRT